MASGTAGKCLHAGKGSILKKSDWRWKTQWHGIWGKYLICITVSKQKYDMSVTVITNDWLEKQRICSELYQWTAEKDVFKNNH